jgi:predicted amino acid racemase
MASPYLTIDLNKIEHNTRTIATLCKDHGIAVSGVTKVVCGNPEVARAMLRGGVESIADSRLENIERMQQAGIDADYILLRLPPLSAVEEVVQHTTCSLNSELAVIQALSAAASKQQKIHEVILMVELGDLREGVMPERLSAIVVKVIKLPAIRLVGLGANLACFAGVVPSRENMNQLVALADQLQRQFGLKLPTLSAINSSGLELIASGRMPRHINHARIGEAILLGRETTHRRPWPDTYQDAFQLHAEILELKRKPSTPHGELAEDAFGHRPTFADNGEGLRALLNVGREDVDIEGLSPLDKRLKVLGGSSGYLVLDVTAVEGELKVGDEMVFDLNYSALLAAMTSEYVRKIDRNSVAVPNNMESSKR